MRRWIWIAAVLALAGIGYGLWPFFGLYQLGAALHAADADAALRRIDVPAVRRSIIRQVLDEGTKGTKIEKRFGDIGRRMAVDAATVALDRKASQVMTAEVLRELIAEGRLPASFGSAIGDLQAGITPAPQDGGGSGGIPDSPLRYLQSWDFSSPRQVKVVLGDSQKRDEWTGLTLRLRGFVWRLTAVTLSPSVMSRVKPPLRAKIEAADF